MLVITFFHNVAFNAGTFYLALYYQVRLRRFIGILVCSEIFRLLTGRRRCKLDLNHCLTPWDLRWHPCQLLGS